MTHENNYFIKEEVHDHRKATKLVMSLSVLTLKQVTFNANRVTSDPENVSRTAKESSILLLQTLKGGLTQKIMRIPQPQSSWVLKG